MRVVSWLRRQFCLGKDRPSINELDHQIDDVKDEIKNHSVSVRRKLTRVQASLKSVELVMNNKK